MAGLTDKLKQDLHLTNFRRERQPVVWALALAIGALVGALTVIFILSIGSLERLAFGDSQNRVASAARSLAWWHVIAIPVAAGGLVSLMLKFLSKTGRPSGVADVIAARAFQEGRMKTREGIVSAIVSVTSLGLGASAGREGPAVHFGAVMASQFGRWLNYPPAISRILLASGAAAAVSASFNAPIAGVLFALEVVLGHYAVRAFAPIVIASLMGALVARAALGETPAFFVPADVTMHSLFELPAFAFLGVLSALVAMSFMRATTALEDQVKRLAVPLWAMPIAAGFVVGVIAVFVPEVLGVGYEATDRALNGEYALGFVLVLLVAKFAASAITLAGRFGGGVFSPSLLLGAATGVAFGLVAAQVMPVAVSSPSLYAVIGMGAVSAAVLGAPISTTLIIFELTRSYEIAVATMMAASIATVMTQSFLGRSYFIWQLERRGLHISEGTHEAVMTTILVREVMVPPPSWVRGASPVRGFTAETDSLAPDDTLERALAVIDRSHKDRISVVDRSSGRVVGIVTAQALYRRFNRALIDIHREEHA